MKLRVHGNGIRLRLNRRDVDEFARNGRIEAAIEFPGQPLVYSLEQGGAAAEADFDGQTIRIRIPAPVAADWTGSDRVGIEEQVGNLAIVIEKDFQCMHKGDDAKDPDGYPNPMAAA